MNISLSKRNLFAIAIFCIAILPISAWRGIPIEVGLPFNIRNDFHPVYKCMYDENDNLYGYYQYEYDDEGNVTSEMYTPIHYKVSADIESANDVEDTLISRTVRKSKTSSEIDELGRTIAYYTYWIDLDIPIQTERYEYDDVLTNLPILYIQSTNTEKCAQKYDIKRNEYGNVVSAYHYKTDWQPIDKEFDFKEDFHVIVKYNEHQEAETIEYYDNFYRNIDNESIKYIDLHYTYSDIKWLKTDGQIIDKSNPYGPVCWDEGGNTEAWNASSNIRNKGNLIYSVIETEYNRNDDGDIKYTYTYTYNVDYTEAEGEFTIYRDDKWIYAVKVLDDRGSYTLNERIYTWDPWGKQLNFGHPDWWDYNPSKWVEAKYDPETGFPIEYKTCTNGYWYYDHWYGSYKATTERFISPYSSGLDEILDSDNFEDVEYYDLNGVKVNKANLLPGIYIILQGNHSTKVRI